MRACGAALRMTSTAAGRSRPLMARSTRTSRQSAVSFAGRFTGCATSCSGTPSVFAAPVTRLLNMRSEDRKTTAGISGGTAGDVVLGVELFQLLKPEADVVVGFAGQVAHY